MENFQLKGVKLHFIVTCFLLINVVFNIDELYDVRLI
jgi:hypothetical protein